MPSRSSTYNPDLVPTKIKRRRGNFGRHDKEGLLEQWEKKKEASRLRSAEIRKASVDIGPLPEVKNPKRREAARLSLEVFCKEYFPDVFSLEFSEGHREVIHKMETAIRESGRFALAMPRSSGKTQLATHAALWALCFGFKRFVLIVAANEDAANELMGVIKNALQFSDLLLEDFPQIVYPIRKLDGIPRKAMAQTLDGERTCIDINASGITLPTVKGSLASGSRIQSIGLLGRIRGTTFMTPDGHALRPDLCICDDPSTDESAASPEGNAKRLRVLNSTILGLGSAEHPLSVVVPCTVIRNGDMADTLLTDCPGWTASRFSLLTKMPSESAMKMWIQYKEIWRRSIKETGNISMATEYWRAHQEQLEEGAVAGWPARYQEDECGPIQHACNLWCLSERAFWAEYQNQPKSDESEEQGNLKDIHIKNKIIGTPKGEIPEWAEYLILSIDIQHAFLPWQLCAFSSSFDTHICDYGAFPAQRREYYSTRDCSVTLENAYPGLGLEARTYQALTDLCKLMVNKVYKRADGSEIIVDAITVDSGYGKLTDLVYKWAHESEWSRIVNCYKGMALSANNRSFLEYRKTPGEKIGQNWLLKPMQKRSRQKLFLVDTFAWRSFVRERILTPRGEKGCLTICGNPDNSELIIDAFTSEYSHVVVGHRRVDAWAQKLNRTNQHEWDCQIMAAATASLLGAKLDVETMEQQVDTQPKTVSAVQEKKGYQAYRNSYKPNYAPSPSRPPRVALSGTIGVKR